MGTYRMKLVTSICCFIFLALLVIPPVSAAATASITTISPTRGYADGSTVTYTITGVNFTTTAGEVYLEKSGESDIGSTIVDWSPTTIRAKIRITSSKETGNWYLVVRQGVANGLEAKKIFSVVKEVELTSITPKFAEVDNDSVKFTLLGENFDEDTIEDVYLYNDDYDNISADDFDVASSTKITGTFDLSDTDEDEYEVCIEDTYGNVFCDLSFEITTNAVGSVDVSSNPSGASVYVDGILKGTTPVTIDDIIEGSHRIILKKSGYQEWGKMVTIEADDTVEVDATLYEVVTYTATPPPTTWVTVKPTTARTTAKSTIKVPTSWVSTPTTAASPVDPFVVVGATGIALSLVLYRRR